MRELQFLLHPQYGMRSIAMGVSVCLSVPFMSEKRHVETSQNFLYMLPEAVARSSSDDNVIQYILPVLWIVMFADNGLYSYITHGYEGI